MDTSSSSKVTVEYHDPSGVFPLVAREIASRLPLRNLNWQSPSRPLRQIKSLHLELVPDQSTKETLRQTSVTSESRRASSFDIVRSGADSRKNAVKERRHQIPGLQTSPFLKVYVLRCDDKDTYKATERKKLRDWIRDEAAAASAKAKRKGKGEDHDAFEWLILHVVIPDTVAAGESRWRLSNSKDSDELKERPKQGAKWPGKSTRTVFDKLRADFNETGKGSQDRVAQIRLIRDQVPVDLLPTPAVASTIEETNEEREKAWDDLTRKLKALILGPFDVRVRQYEADIAEQESRRSLPGFNFCTFFIHKEGLAKALESIGLVEDALVIYDELSLGLETVLRDAATGKAEGTVTTFAPYTDDIKDRIIGSRRSATNGTNTDGTNTDENDDQAELFHKDYRQQIVTSTISVFDFVCYLFTRQKALLLRLANAKTARAEISMNTKDGGEDLVLTSEVCWRASTFIHNNARTLRRDLLQNRAASHEGHSHLTRQEVESLVCSWVYIAAGQVLDETATSTIDSVLENDRRDSLSNGGITGPRRSDFTLAGLGANPYPQRTTSLPGRKSRVSELQKRTSIQSASETDLTSPPSSSGTDGTKSTNANFGSLPGMPELLTYRAELVMMRRKMLEIVAKQRSWVAGWAAIREKTTSKMEEVDLNDDPAEKAEDDEASRSSASSLLSPSFATAVKSEETFHVAYEKFSHQAIRYYVTATQTKSAETVMGDLAMLNCARGDFEYALTYFRHVLPLYTYDGWNLMEAEALSMQAKCFKALDRREDYIKTMLSLLEKVCARQKKSGHLFMRMRTADDEEMTYRGMFSDLVEVSEGLPIEVIAPADRFFSDIELGRQIIHRENWDGFALRLYLTHDLEDTIEIDQASVRLVHIKDPKQEIWLATNDAVKLQPGKNDFGVETTTVAYGAYLVDKVVLKARKLTFEHGFQPKVEPLQIPSGLAGTEPAALKSPEPPNRPWVFVYPTQRAFHAELAPAKNIYVNKPRHLEVRLSSGWNEIQKIDLKFKPASAGLRLHLADATMDNVGKLDQTDARPGQIRLGSLRAEDTAVVKLFYSLEQPMHEIVIHMEAQYHTSGGSFTFATSARLDAALALDVDVDDMFHLDALFSKFTVRTTGRSPLLVTNVELQPSPEYAVEAPPILPMPMTVSSSQPVRILYKITRRQTNRASASNKEAALALSVHYHSVNELASATVQKRFRDNLSSSSFASLSRLLLPFLHERTKRLLSNADVETAALLSDVKTPSYGEIGWREVVATLPAAIQRELTDWLQTWHEQYSHISLDQHAALQEHVRCITISVDVPTIDYVYNVSLSLPEHQQTFTDYDQDRILVLGQPITAQLRIKHTQNWSSKAPSPSPGLSEEAFREGKFLYDVHADADSWLIGGPRRAHFVSSKEVGGEQTFEITLIPLRLGLLSLPRIDIQVAETPLVDRKDGGESGPRMHNPPERPLFSCETHYESAGQVVKVIRDVRSVSVHVPESTATIVTQQQQQTQPSPWPAVATKKDGG